MLTLRQKMNINLVSVKNNCEFTLKIHGKVIINAEDEILMTTKKKYAFVVLDNKGKIETIFRYLKEDGLKYHDEFNNKIIANEQHLQLQPKEKLKLGDGKENVVLGNTFKDLFDELLTEISNITITTSIGQMPVINKIKFEELKLKTKTAKILSAYI